MIRNPLELMDIQISFSKNTKPFNSYFTRRTKLLIPQKEPDLLRTIFEVDIGESFNDFKYENLNTNFLDRYSQKFNQIKERHRHIVYKGEFRCKEFSRKNYFIKYKRPNFNKEKKMNREKKLHYVVPKKCKNQVHSAQVQEGVRRICHKLLPLELIGSEKNNEKIFKAWKNFIKTGVKEPFSLLNLVKNLDLESITWTKAIDDEILKLILVGKFIKWLFLVLMAIVEKVFLITHSQGEKIFIFLEDWQEQKQDCVKSMCQKRVLQLIGPIKKSTEVKCTLRFIAKPDKLRPIIIYEYRLLLNCDKNDSYEILLMKYCSITGEEKNFLRKTNAVLQYLSRNNYQRVEKPFYQNFIGILQAYKCKDKRIYIVTCDIANAFGSMLQGKLYDIVQTLFEKLPKILTFEYIEERNIKRYQLINEGTRCDPRRCETASKDIVLEVLRRNIFQTDIAFKKHIYNMNRGVSQGLPISHSLCQLYFAAMSTKYFADFENNGFLLRYVDDYLFITDQLGFAKKFLDVIKKGIPEFNCFFKENKVQHNLDPETCQKIKYLGWEFESQSLQIKPIYNSTRHSVNYNNLSESTIQWRLRYWASVKLHRLILARGINSNRKIFENIALVFRRQAERCFAYSSYLYNTKQKKIHPKFIISSNEILLKELEKLMNLHPSKRKENKLKLQYLMWSTFYNIFRKRRDIFSHLTATFKELMEENKGKKN